MSHKLKITDDIGVYYAELHVLKKLFPLFILTNSNK